MAKVSDDSREQLANAPVALKWSVFLAIVGIVLLLCVLVVRPFFGVLAWSTVLAVTCYPLHQRLVRRTGRVRLSACVTSAVLVLAVLVPVVLVGAVAVHQLLAVGHSLREALQDPDGASRRIAAAGVPLLRRLGLDTGAIGEWASGNARQWVAAVGQRTMSAAAGVGGALVSFVFTAVATYLLLRHGEKLVATITDLLPFERTRSKALLLRIRDVVHACIYGVVTIAAIQGVLCGGMFWLLGVPAAALWGLVTMFASMVPVVGTAAVWVPGTVYLLATGAWPKAIVLAVWGAAIVSGVDNVLRPKLVAGRVRLSGLAMFVAMLGGLQAFGALGIILGPVLFATVAAILDLLRETERSRTLKHEDGGPPRIPSAGHDFGAVRRGGRGVAVAPRG